MFFFFLEKNLQVLCINEIGYFNKFLSNHFFRNFVIIKIDVRN
jgi:hypothetical protein